VFYYNTHFFKKYFKYESAGEKKTAVTNHLREYVLYNIPNQM